jgi:hypothetical protein
MNSKPKIFLAGFMSLSSLALALAVGFVFALVNPASAKLTSFGNSMALPQIRSNQIDYSIVPSREKYFVWVPPNYNGSEPFGLIVYISSMDTSAVLPAGWEEVLTRYRMIFVSPQSAGNDCEDMRRSGLALVGALQMKANYKIDPRRVFAAGLSGGARIACNLGFWQSDVFRGTIQDCGANFYRKVDSRRANNWVDSEGNTYGVMDATADEISRARSGTRFCLITGTGDFRRDNVIDIYNNGFARDGFRARLFDVPGMGHQDCDAATLEQALRYLIY